VVEFCPVMFFKIDDKKQKPHMRKCRGSFNLHEYFPSRVFQIHSTGMGFVMIKRKVMEKVKFKHIHTKKLNIGEDIAFCVDAQKKGFKVFCDSYLWALHLKDEKAINEKKKQIIEYSLPPKRK
jgi:GT2 family glycosyltransferase